MEVTNYIIKSTAVKFKERYILANHRRHMHAVEKRMRKLRYEPVLVVGQDGLWWNDEIEFVLDRMSDCGCNKGTPLYDFAQEIYANPLKVGEKRKIVYEGETYTIEADCTDVSKGGRMTNDCEPID